MASYPPSRYPPFLRRAARPQTVAARRFMRPGEFDVRSASAALAGFSLAEAASTGRGVLPLSEWPKADAAIAALWKMAAQLEENISSRWYTPGTDGESISRNALENFKRRAQDASVLLERLKHEPTFGASDPVRKVQDWVDFVSDMEPWARQIDSTSSFASIWGMIKDVGTATALDIGKGVQATGDSVIGAGKISLWIVKYAPIIALAGGGVLLYLWGNRIVAPAGEAIRVMSSATAERIRSGLTPSEISPGPVAGYTRRRPRRRRR